MKKHITALVVATAAAVLLPSQVIALGFGQVVPSATLGQPLNVAVPVHVEAGERFAADCVQAEVLYGDAKLLPNQVRTDIERGRRDGDWLVRVTSSVPINEPVVEIGLSAGCERRFTRRLTAFADPPSFVPAPAPLAQAAPAQAAPPSAEAETPPAAAAAAAPGAVSPGAATSAGNATRAAAAKRVRARDASVPRGPTRAAAAAGSRLARAAPAASPAPAPATTAEARARLLLDAGFAHLKLDMEDPIVPLPRTPGASGATIAISDLELDPDAKRVQDLEKNVSALRRESAASRDRTEKLQARLAEAESRNDWLPWLLALLALALAGLAALAWRMRVQSRVAHSAWFKESQHATLQPPAPAPAPNAVAIAAASVRPVPPPAPDAGPPSVAGELVDGPAEPTGPKAMAAAADRLSATQPLARSAIAAAMAESAAQAAASPREVSVEELLDLEQQADFFIALGQEDAAVDLLMSHLRSAGGQSPLPYTKLLEIYRRQGDRSAYERTRARFNRRFNAYAPDWDVGPGAGRTLEDYPDAIAQVQAAWPAPIDAMAILEALLFKRDDSSELFDLPAYRDVLVLYSLARDLWQQSGGAATATPVDVLLPIGDGTAPSAAGPVRAPLPTASPASSADADTRFQLTGYDLLPPGTDGVSATLDEGQLDGPPDASPPDLEHPPKPRRAQR